MQGALWTLPVLIRSIAEPASQRDHAPEAFLWIGRLVWYKRPPAFVELARALPEAKFWMVGVPAVHGRESPDLVRRSSGGRRRLPISSYSRHGRGKS